MRASEEATVVWYEVTGRGSGRKLDGIHGANTDAPYGEMTTRCGVGISSAFTVTYPKPWQHKCRACRRIELATSRVQSA